MLQFSTFYKQLDTHFLVHYRYYSPINFMGGFMKEVFSIFACFITIGLSSGAMSVIAAAIISLVGLGTMFTLWLKREA